MFDVVDDVKRLPAAEAAHRHVILGAGARRQRIDRRRVTQHFILRHCKSTHLEAIQTLFFGIEAVKES